MVVPSPAAEAGSPAPIVAPRWVKNFAADRSQPFGIAEHPDGRIFVSDLSNHEIAVYSKSGVFLDKFGSLGTGQGQFDQPTGLAFGPDGNLFVADFVNDRVQVVTTAGDHVRFIGASGSGNGQLNGPVDPGPIPTWIVEVEAAGERTRKNPIAELRCQHRSAARHSLEVACSAVQEEYADPLSVGPGRRPATQRR